MSKSVAAVSKIVAIIESLGEEERQRVFDAVITLTGLSRSYDPGDRTGQSVGLRDNRSGEGPGVSAKEYFDAKGPQNKIEELAVAARYLEENEGAEEVSKDDLSRVFKAARRNFDKNNFNRDMTNAKTRGLFNKGSSAGQNALSHAGQGYVDNLPERDTTRLKKRSSTKRVKKVAKKSAKR
ncbi:hypothetical protein [Pseudoxanthomonas winnipegensis]|uniref:hypothetical protein n=1 Tax=Pseudoxanthomonas winnipegensis TaxID=2480810 RepID=UPI003F824A2B